jgi:hypothetical protein
LLFGFTRSIAELSLASQKYAKTCNKVKFKRGERG